MLKQGYEKVYYILNSHLLVRAEAGATRRRFQTKPGLFKIATFRRWIVVPSGPELIEEVMKAPDTAMAVLEPFLDVRTAAHITSRLAPSQSPQILQTRYTLVFLNKDDMYHRSIIRSRLTRNIAATFDQVHEELAGAMKDCIPTTGQGTSHIL
jgi:hypothetical protein